MSGGDPTGVDTLIGKTLPGGFQIVEFIAEGSMGRVYRAEQASLGRSVAVKMMNAALLSHPTMIDRFRTEARAASMLNHPNCMRVYDFGETSDKCPYLVMELLHGKDLEIILRDEPLLPLTRVFDITLQVLRALEEAHDQGIVHRDLKPANVFVLPQRAGGELVKVVDFGLAKLRSAISGSTMTGIICGTPAYMAPEQATGSETDARTDLYAVGVMLYEMIAGRLPFSSDEPTELLRNHVFDLPPQLSAIGGERVVPGIEPIVGRALAKSPKDRFENAEAFALKLQELLAIRGAEGGRTLVRASLQACSECGGLFPATSRFCGECGAPAPRESLPTPSLSGGASALPEGTSSERPTPASISRPAVTRPSATSIRAEPEPSEPRTYRMSWGREETGPRQRHSGAPVGSSRDPRADAEPPRTPTPERAPVSRRQSLPTLDDTGPRQSPYARENDLGGDTAATLVHLERVAARRAEAGDHHGAVAALRRAIIHIKNDMDRGELDDPIGAMTLFTGKLGEALVTAGEAGEALEALREAVALMKPGAERVRLLLVMSRAAREIGRDDESRRYLTEAEEEAEARISSPGPTSQAPAPRRPVSSGLSEPPDERTSGVNLSRRIDTPAPLRGSSSVPTGAPTPRKKSM